MKSEVVLTEQELPSDVIAAIEQGRKIEAIKILREHTGIGLANAKVLVDRAANRLGVQRPIPAMGDHDNGVGRLMKSLLLVSVLAGLYYFVVGI